MVLLTGPFYNLCHHNKSGNRSCCRSSGSSGSKYISVSCTNMHKNWFERSKAKRMRQRPWCYCCHWKGKLADESKVTITTAGPATWSKWGTDCQQLCNSIVDYMCSHWSWKWVRGLSMAISNCLTRRWCVVFFVSVLFFSNDCEALQKCKYSWR
jgi:hypothetical protein